MDYQLITLLVFFALYIFLFVSTINGLSSEDKKIYKESGNKLLNILIIPMIFALIYFRSKLMRLGLGSALISFVIFGTYFHHKKLLLAGFDAESEKKLRWITILSLVVIIIFVKSLLPSN